MKKENEKALHIFLPKDLVAKIDALAKAGYRNRLGQIRHLLFTHPEINEGL